MGSWVLVWILCTTVILMPVCLHGSISVHLKTGEPLYVALGKTLVLEAVFNKNPGDVIDMVTWDRQRGNEVIRLSAAHGSRISLEKGDALLRITDVAEGDFGIYRVTVTDSNGYQEHDSIEVQKIEEPPNVQIARLLECVLDEHDKAQSDSPQISWLVDGVPVTNQTGSRLNISEFQGVNYTCVIKSNLKESRSCWVGLIIVGLVVITALCVAAWVMKKSFRENHEHPARE